MSLGRQLLAWLALGIAGLILAIYAHSRCEISVPNQEPPKSEIEQHTANDSAYPVHWIWIAQEEVQAEDHQQKLYQKTQRRSWFCNETKITDLLLAFFAYALAVVSWISIQSAEKSVRDANRAYVSGGGPPSWQRRQGQLFADTFHLTIDNYGKTPATLIEYAIGFCERNNIGNGPAYHRQSLRATFPPGTKGQTIDLIPVPPHLQQPVVYGRFWYEDVWGRPHEFGFILPLDMQRLPDQIPKAYTRVF